MYSDLCDFIEVNGLQSITVLFNVISKWQGQEWKRLEETEGAELLQKLSGQEHFFIEEVNRTHWFNRSQPLADTYYSIHLSEKELYAGQRLSDILRFLIDLKRNYRTAQIFINNIYELDREAQGLADYLRLIEGTVH